MEWNHVTVTSDNGRRSFGMCSYKLTQTIKDWHTWVIPSQRKLSRNVTSQKL